MIAPRLYAPGDPDPTAACVRQDCPAVGRLPHYDGRGSVPMHCTWDAGHAHPQHIAGGLGRNPKVLFAWDVEP